MQPDEQSDSPSYSFGAESRFSLDGSGCDAFFAARVRSEFGGEAAVLKRHLRAVRPTPKVTEHAKTFAVGINERNPALVLWECVSVSV